MAEVSPVVAVDGVSPARERILELRAWNSAREGLRYEQRTSRDSDAHILEPLHPKTRGAR